MTEQPKHAFFPQQVLAANFGQTRLDRHPCMASDGKLTMYATPWAMHFRDDINSLEEFDEGYDFVRELNGDLKKVFYLYAEDFLRT